LRHLITLALPAQSLVVMGIHVSSNVDWLKHDQSESVLSFTTTIAYLPVHEVASALSNVENS
jgi:hypothetical protein